MEVVCDVCGRKRGGFAVGGVKVVVRVRWSTRRELCGWGKWWWWWSVFVCEWRSCVVVVCVLVVVGGGTLWEVVRGER